MPLSRKEFLKLAFQLAEELKLPHCFNNNNEMAGKAFYNGFMARFPELSLRTPESMSMMRATGFNKHQVSNFFVKLEYLYSKQMFPPLRIYNADETGISCVHENTKVISLKGKRQVGKLTSGERGKKHYPLVYHECQW
ncbi:hypothetical protein C0J52_14336 [Blattella germanica]|nr:hypothetical protein C0J52_14336 [Blattella germanica]